MVQLDLWAVCEMQLADFANPPFSMTKLAI
jgi:hypothetical protein